MIQEFYLRFIEKTGTDQTSQKLHITAKIRVTAIYTSEKNKPAPVKRVPVRGELYECQFDVTLPLF
jgi:hypothetical protein